MFEDRKAIIIGERDGVAGPAIVACVKAAGGAIAYEATACFV